MHTTWRLQTILVWGSDPNGTQPSVAWGYVIAFWGFVTLFQLGQLERLALLVVVTRRAADALHGALLAALARAPIAVFGRPGLVRAAAASAASLPVWEPC